MNRMIIKTTHSIKDELAYKLYNRLRNGIFCRVQSKKEQVYKRTVLQVLKCMK